MDFYFLFFLHSESLSGHGLLMCCELWLYRGLDMSVLSGPYTKSWVWQYLIANTDTTDMDKRLSACCYSTKVASGSVTDRHTSDMTSFISI